MDLLYVIGNGSLLDNIELRMSLRSVDKLAANVDNVVIVGTIPSFVNRRTARCIEINDAEVHGKHWNMLWKIVEGIDSGLLKGDFLYSSDDHFLLREVDFDDWPRIKRGEMYTLDEYRRDKGKEPGRYQKSIVSTRELCSSLGWPISMTTAHMNIHMNTDELPDVLKAIQHAKDNNIKSVYGFEPMILFNNAYMKKHPDVKYIDVNDCKAKQFEDVQHIRDTGGKCFSVYDSAWSGGKLRKMLTRMFPSKSKWER